MPDRYDCELAPEEVPDRAEQVRRLRRGLLAREAQEGAVRLRSDPAVAPLVREFVRDESRCCSFFEFDLRHQADAVELVVRAPAEAEPLLSGLHDVFAPDGGAATP